VQVGGPGRAWFAGQLAHGLVEASDDLDVLDRGGWWAVVVTFEGQVRLWRFAHRILGPLPQPRAPWPGVTGHWTTSLDRQAYRDGVAEIRRRIKEGEVYQVNLCRLVSAQVGNPINSPHTGPCDISPDGADDAAHNPWALAVRLARGNPAPYSGVIDVPEFGGLPRTRVVSASPEVFLRREADMITCSPIKGTGRTAADLLAKDRAENVMIVDLMRNDLQRTCRPGTVEVTGLLEIEQHPGLVHLVSTVRGRLLEGATWAQVLAATMPPGSVSGAPKSSALRAITDLEPVARGPYCGAIGWVDADAGTACLAVGIRTFWWEDRAPSGSAPDLRIWFGTGAGITWGSDPDGEWAETELKAARLIELASTPDRFGTDLPDSPGGQS
jgi:para-aminobenzoate synthetase component I